MVHEPTGEDGLEVRDDWPEAEPARRRRCASRCTRSSVNFPDVLITRDLYQMSLEPPFVPGNECAGVVTEVGAEVDDSAVGDRVLALTGGRVRRERARDPAPDQVHRIPDEMPFDDAAAFNLTYGTAGLGLARGQIQPGETVLVLGRGGRLRLGGDPGGLGHGCPCDRGGGRRGEDGAARGELGADHVIDHLTTDSLSAR